MINKPYSKVTIELKENHNINEIKKLLTKEGQTKISLIINNRDKIKESESFVLTLHKDKSTIDISKRRINIRKILSLDDIMNKPYSRVTIELKENHNIEEIKNLLQFKGQTQINLIINDKNKKIHYNLENLRKLDLNQLKMIKSKEYVKKITV